MQEIDKLDFALWGEASLVARYKRGRTSIVKPEKQLAIYAMMKERQLVIKNIA